MSTAWHAQETEIAEKGQREKRAIFPGYVCASSSGVCNFIFLDGKRKTWKPDNASIGIFGTNNQCTSKTLFQMASKVSYSPGGVFERFLTVATKVNASLMDLSCTLHSAWLFYNLKSFSPHNEN